MESDNLVAYHLTIDYKAASSSRSATNCLRRFLPVFFTKTLSPNWLRYKKQFEVHAFVEPPGAAYHHHAILLLTASLSKRFERKCLSLLPDDDDDNDDGTAPTDFQRQFADSYKLPLFMAKGVVIDWRHSPVRTVCVQPLYEELDIIKCSSYAAKKYDFLAEKNTSQDDGYLIFPL